MAQSEGLVHAIQASAAAGAARYFAGERGSRGDYYLEPTGRQGEPPGRWVGDEQALRALGLDRGAKVSEHDLLALMQGRHPRTGGTVRQPARLGNAIVAHDIHWAPPKSASLLWAYSDSGTRRQIEAAFEAACDVGVAELQKLAVLREYRGGKQVGVTGGLVAARFIHHTARLAQGELEPDPQLHAHNLLLVGRRADGRWSAVTNFHVMRSRARIDALVMGEFAFRLRQMGFETVTGGKGRWEVAGISRELIERNSKRRADIERTAERAAAAVRGSMRERYLRECQTAGRDPTEARLREIYRFELDAVARRPLGRSTRGTKAEVPLGSDLHRRWRERDGIDERFVASLRRAGRPPATREAALQRLTQELVLEVGLRVDPDTPEAARQPAATEDDLVAAGVRLVAQEVGASEAEQLTRRAVRQLVVEGRLIELPGSRFATPAQLEIETRVLESWTRGRTAPVGVVDARLRDQIASEIERERGIALTGDQREALGVMTGPGEVVAITGDAGTGKGVTAAVAVRGWERSGHQVIGIAHANATAQRLQALGVSETMSVHMLLHRLERGQAVLDSKTVLLLDEATMVDTALMARLERARTQSGAKLVQLGDDKQLGSISAGGLFALATEKVPHARLRSMVRYGADWLAEAVRHQGEGRSERALALLEEHKALRWEDSAPDARAAATREWARAHDQGAGAADIKIFVASSNRETDRLNRLVQAERLARGELGPDGVELPGRGMELRAGDLVIFRDHFCQPGRARVVNGTTGTVVGVDRARSELRIRTDERRPRTVTVAPGRFFREQGEAGQPECGLRAAYAIHVQPGQGMTVRHAIAVTDWQSGRESATVQMSRGADSFVLVVNRGSSMLEQREGTEREALEAQLRLSTVHRAALDRRLEPERTPLERAVRKRLRTIANTVSDRARVRSQERQREHGQERER